MLEPEEIKSTKNELHNDTTEKVYAKKVECILGLAGKFNMLTVPPTMGKDEYRYCRNDRVFYGEKETIEAITPNILQKIYAVEELFIHGNHMLNAYFTLTSKFFEAFRNNGVSLRELRCLEACSCILQLTMDEIILVLKDCKLTKFTYVQNRIPRENYYGTPVNFLCDKLLENITESVERRACCDSFCPSVTDFTLGQWKKSLPSTICLENCHTSFTLLAIWSMIRAAVEHNKSVQWNFGCINADESNQKTLIEMQKMKKFGWTKRLNNTHSIKYASVESTTSSIAIEFRMIYT